MTRYRVFEPGEAEAPSERAVFVRDRFSTLAFLFSVLWLLRYGLFAEALVALAVLIGLALGAMQGFGFAAVLLGLLVSWLLGLEASSLRAARYRRNGFSETAAFHADSRREAEITYYAGRAGETAVSRAPVAPIFARPASHGRTLLDAPRTR